mmetsp:Transcript_92048/g.177458  ORF Transcript_92048/g.177458 Transcript_92048/m.177458 type:complete len:145 (+) Transcript_92048:1802-2236(+)
MESLLTGPRWCAHVVALCVTVALKSMAGAVGARGEVKIHATRPASAACSQRAVALMGGIVALLMAIQSFGSAHLPTLAVPRVRLAVTVRLALVLPARSTVGTPWAQTGPATTMRLLRMTLKILWHAAQATRGELLLLLLLMSCS